MRRFSNPLGFGKTPSRFSDPRPLADAERFGVLYLGGTLKVCFLEAVLRDQRDGNFGDFPIGEEELMARLYGEISIETPLNVIDLRDDAPLIMGVPSDVAGASDQALARQWSLAFHEHPQQPDGIIYPSRLNGQTNIAVFDRAIFKLVQTRLVPLIEAAGLFRVLSELEISLVAADP